MRRTLTERIVTNVETQGITVGYNEHGNTNNVNESSNQLVIHATTTHIESNNDENDVNRVNTLPNSVNSLTRSPTDLIDFSTQKQVELSSNTDNYNTDENDENITSTPPASAISLSSSPTDLIDTFVYKCFQ